LTGALGSVRQLADDSSALTLGRNYDPFGKVDASTGTSNTMFGFTNEYTSKGLVNLRSRLYDPSDGRFLSHDIWGGNDIQPMSFNFWLYVYGNPINLSDPLGKYPSIGANIENIRYQELYGISFSGAWPEEDQRAVFTAVDDVSDALYKAYKNRPAYYPHTQRIFSSAPGLFSYIYQTSSSSPLEFRWNPKYSDCRSSDLITCCGTDLTSTCGDLKGSVCQAIASSNPNETCTPRGALTRGLHLIDFASLSPYSPMFDNKVRNVVHELGHAFSVSFNNVPNKMVDTDFMVDGVSRNFADSRENILHRNGEIDPKTGTYKYWQFNREKSGPETFADMFVAFTYDQWNTNDNPIRNQAKSWMTNLIAWLVGY
jgi:RHS repeat-associated protein